MSASHSHTAAAFLAATHFNNRDASVVPELADPFFRDECTFQFDLNASHAIDTGMYGNYGGREMLRLIRREQAISLCDGGTVNRRSR